MTQKQYIKNLSKYTDNATAIIFFAASFAYTLFIIKPQLIYHAISRQTPSVPFTTDFDYMLQTISQPAGLLDYIASFTAHCFSIPLIATIIITAISIAVFVAARLILKNSRPAKLLAPAAFLPAILVIATYTRYANQTRDLLTIIIAGWAVSTYLSTKWNLRRPTTTTDKDEKKQLTRFD